MGKKDEGIKTAIELKNKRIHTIIPIEDYRRYKALNGTTISYLIRLGLDRIEGKLKQQDSEDGDRVQRTLKYLINRAEGLNAKINNLSLRVAKIEDKIFGV